MILLLYFFQRQLFRFFNYNFDHMFMTSHYLKKDGTKIESN
jgi:hypothetical protein